MSRLPVCHVTAVGAVKTALAGKQTVAVQTACHFVEAIVQTPTNSCRDHPLTTRRRHAKLCHQVFTHQTTRVSNPPTINEPPAIAPPETGEAPQCAEALLSLTTDSAAKNVTPSNVTPSLSATANDSTITDLPQFTPLSTPNFRWADG